MVMINDDDDDAVDEEHISYHDVAHHRVDLCFNLRKAVSVMKQILQTLIEQTTASITVCHSLSYRM